MSIPQTYFHRQHLAQHRQVGRVGIFPGQVIEKTGSAGPRCAVILKAGGSKVAVSLDLCSQILVRAI